MTKDRDRVTADIRSRAEKRLKSRRRVSQAPRTPSETDRLLHELQVHQIELEIQNEELEWARAQVEILLAEYTSLYDLAPEGYATLDREGTIERMNIAGARLLGYERSQLINRRFGLFVAEGDRRAFSDFLLRVISSRTKESCEIALLQKRAVARIVCVDATSSRDGRECRAIITDVTDRRRAEDTLRVHSSALNAAAQPMIITDCTGTILWTNTAFEVLTGYSAEEAIGQDLLALIRATGSEGGFELQPWGTLSAGEVWSGETTDRRKDGSEYLDQLTITPVINPAGETTHLIAIMRDLTEQRLLESQLRQAQKMEAVGLLAGGIAHDFNNLLTVINGTAELALTSLPEGNPQRAALDAILGISQRAASLTFQLLAFSRKQVMKVEPVDLGARVAGLQPMLERLIGEDIALEVQIASGIGSVMADPTQMDQVVLNLALNAREAMSYGGSLRIDLREVETDGTATAPPLSRRPASHVLLTISDSGTGMDEATRSRIFEPFFTTKGLGTGSGLGLSTVYGIVKQSGGTIDVSSELGQGTTFRIYLPRAEPAGDRARPVSNTALNRGSETVLLVEDEAAVRNLAEVAMKKAGYRMLVASNGEDALSLAEQQEGDIDLLITDIVMPGISGWELARKVADVRPRTRVLYTSGYFDDSILEDRTIEGAHFLAKPYSLAQLAQKARALLDA